MSAEQKQHSVARFGGLAHAVGIALPSLGRTPPSADESNNAHAALAEMERQYGQVVWANDELNAKLDGLEEQYQTALDRLWEAHDQLCGCDKPADEGRCSAPEETWGAFEYLGERQRDSNPASKQEDE